MHILALEPFYGGSHQVFLDSWIERSEHQWTLLTLPATKWKWLMRHSAATFAEEVERRWNQGERWDLVFCTDMLNLAEFRGLADREVARLPSVIYFHENQFTYPVRREHERDFHFAMTNLTSALAADQVWFNSAYHRDDFLEAAGVFLKRMPDRQLPGAIAAIRAKTQVHPPGIVPFPPRQRRDPGPLRIVWSARWEHDKGPDVFFAAVQMLAESGCDFRLSVLGEQFAEIPPVFEQARRQLRLQIAHWGYVESGDEYREILTHSDVVVSTAGHEFFGIAIVEAMAAGAYPLLPSRLSYPELLSGDDQVDPTGFLYDGSAEQLTARLRQLQTTLQQTGTVWTGDAGRLVRLMTKYHLDRLVPQRDQAVKCITR
ncbi:MAG: DUF3524 domain-containing protein [bacterium]